MILPFKIKGQGHNTDAFNFGIPQTVVPRELMFTCTIQ